MNYVCSRGQLALRFVCLLLLVSFFAFAQSDTASITGFVHDPSRATVPNATVVIKNEATGVERRAVTNQSGYYAVSSLPPGLYTVTVESPGFKRFEKTQNKLDPNISANVDADMQVGAASETVNIVAEAAAIQSESATVGKVITSNEVKNIPLNGRNPVLLALLKPGVSGGALAGFTFGLSTGGLNINGSRTQDNLITYDGAVAVRTRSNGTSIGAADVDSVQEVQILTANYNAEYGRSAGGQVRIVTKSGGREFHGDAYEYFRNSAMNANSWTRNQTVGRTDINSRPAPFRFNQPGYDVSGPLLIPKLNKDRNKLFFLFSQEWTRYRQEDLTTVTVPSVAMRNGDFSQLLGSNPFFSSAKYVRDPLKTGVCSAADQTACFPGNIIPANRISANGRALLNSYPLPVAGFLLGSNNFVQSRNSTDNQRKDTGAVDYLPKENHYIRFRVQNYNLLHNDSFRGGTDRAPSTLDRPNQTASVNYIWTVSPTIVNEVLLTASADHVKIFVQPGRYQRSTYGINYPYLFQAKEIYDKIPTISLTGFTDIDGGPYPSSSAGPIYDLSDNITKIHGNHTFKGGFLFERAGQNDFDQINVSGIPGGTNNQNGRFEFRDTRPGGSGLAVADAMLGLYSSYAELGTRSYTPYRGHMYEWFFQDTWKATQKMTLYYGVRHTIVQPYYSLWRNMSVFDVPSYDPKKAVQLDPKTGFIVPNSGDIYNGLIIPGDGFTDAAKGRFPASTDPQYPRLFKGGKSYSQTHYKDFQPRLGLAYALNEKTVIRSGIGRFYTRLGVSDSVFLGGNPPFQPTVSTTNGLVDNPGGNAGNVNFPLIVTTQDPIFKNPEAWTWNATVERELGYGTTLEIGYVGRRGLNQQRERNINQLPAGTLQANPGINADFLRPYKGYGFIRVTNNESTSRYNGLQLGVTRRFSKGLSYGLAYTYSKLYDSGSGQRDIIPNAYDAHNLWAPADYDRRHVAVVNFVWQLPFLRQQTTLLGKIAGGWQLSMIAQFQTGTPFSVAKGDDYAGVGPGSGSQFWNIAGDPHLSNPNWSPGGTADSNLYFNKEAFKVPAPGTYVTNTVRNTLYGPGFQNWTAALFKKFAITERQSVQFRSEFYNFPNHPNWSGPNTDPTNAAFGKITAKNFERSLQLSLRYSF